MTIKEQFFYNFLCISSLRCQPQLQNPSPPLKLIHTYMEQILGTQKPLCYGGIAWGMSHTYGPWAARDSMFAVLGGKPFVKKTAQFFLK